MFKVNSKDTRTTHFQQAIVSWQSDELLLSPSVHRGTITFKTISSSAGYIQ